MSSKFLRLFAVFTVLTMTLTPLNAKPTLAVNGPTTDDPATESIPTTPVITKGVIGGVSDTGLYIVQLNDPSLAAYKGGIPSLSATSPEVTGSRKLDVHTPESQAYLSFLGAQHNDFIIKMEATLGRSVEVEFRYLHVLNGIAIYVSQQEAAVLAAIPGVKSVFADTLREIDTDTGPLWIGADDIWTGNIGSGLSTEGEGVIVGMIDSGINHANSSFADVGGDGYDHTNPWGSGTYGGYCVANPSFCNDKLIAAYDFYPGGSGGPEDTAGHGSHTSSTVAGNHHVVTVTVGITATIQGVAPHANLIAYKVCNPGCPGSSSVMSVDQAIVDGADVLNYSISGSDDPWNDPVDLAFLDAYNAGIFVSASAGNDGPNPGTVAKTGPWNAAVAMSTIPRLYANSIDVTVPVTSTLQDLAALQGDGPALVSDIELEITYQSTNLDGCLAFPAGYFTNKIGLVQRGGCTFAVKVANVFTAGGLAMVVFNNRGGPPIAMGVGGSIPSVMLGVGDGLDLIAEIDAYAPVTARINAAISKVYNEDFADLIDSGSSRGPSQHELLKPDYAAPGVNIFAAVAAAGGDPEQYAFISGTSMAAPHGAGSASLLIALHSDWSPAEVKSALATTTFPWQQMQATTATSVIPANPFDTGSGRLEVGIAANAGFVQDETYTNYVAANPDIGGDPKTLNQPSMVDYSCVDTCVWTRTLTSVLGFSATYTPTFTSTPPTMTVTVEPASFTLPAGGTQVVTITANVTSLPLDQYAFGDVIFGTEATFPGGMDVADQHLTFVVYPASASAPARVSIVTGQTAGSIVASGFQVASDVTDLVYSLDGLTKGISAAEEVFQDPTNGDPFNGDGGTVVITLSVPSGALVLLAEVADSEAPDVDLFVGTGTTPSAGTVVCTSASGIWQESCQIDNPAAGDYWVLAQNWAGSASQPDLIVLTAGAVIPGDQGNLTVDDPGFIPAGDPFSLTFNWDEPTLVDGDYYLGYVTLGTDPGNPGNIGTVLVTLEYTQPVYITKEGPATAFTGDVIAYTTVMTGPNPLAGAAWLTDTLPVGVAYASGLNASFGTAMYDEATNSVYWTNTAPPPLGGASGSQLQVPHPVALVIDSVPAEGSIASLSKPDASVSMILDDGTVERAIGLNGGGFAFMYLWFNRFTPAGGEFPFILNQIDVYFTPNSNAVVGDAIDLVVYEDTNGDPADGATWLKTIPVTLQVVPGLNSYDISADPVVLNGPGDVFIGVVDRWVESGVTPANFPSAQDSTTSQQRSWIATYAAGDPPNPPTLPTDDLYNIIDDFALGGNWIIRGYGETTSPQLITVTFNVTVTAESGFITNTEDLSYNGDLFTADTTLEVVVPPDVTFVSNSPVMLGETGVFTPTVTGTGPFEYLWTFGDGITSTLESPTHTYATAGTYTVTVMVTSDWGSDSYSAGFDVDGIPPEVVFTSNSPITVGGLAVFTPTVTGTGPFEYLWNFGDNITSTQEAPTHTYTASDTYTVTLTVTSEWGEDTYVADFVVIGPEEGLIPVYLPLVWKQAGP